MERNQLYQSSSREVSQQFGKNTRQEKPILTNSIVRKQNSRNVGRNLTNFVMQPHRKSVPNRCYKQFSDTANIKNEEFIQASSTIWLNEGCYNGHIDFSNLNDHWEDIVQINFKVVEELTCPICMEFPRIPRTDKCGHIYCFPCLIKYLTVDNNKYTKCALCNQHLDVNRLKRACIIETVPYKIGDNISLILMKRNKQGYTPIPVEQPDTEIFDIHSNFSQFSNMIICPNEDLFKLINVEIDNLQNILVDSINESDGRADSIEKSLNYIYSELDRHNSNKKMLKKTPIEATAQVDFDFIENESRECYIYYQEENGEYIFLSPLSWSCLKYEYHSKKLTYPLRLSSIITDIEKFTVTDDFINRYRYLKYLPLGSKIYFVDIKISDFVSQETLDKFESKINRKEDEKKLKQEMDLELTKKKEIHEASFYTGPNYQVTYSNTKNENIFNPEEFEPLVSTSTAQLKHEQSTISYASAIRSASVSSFTQPKENGEEINQAPTTFNLSDYMVQNTKKIKNKKKK